MYATCSSIGKTLSMCRAICKSLWFLVYLEYFVYNFYCLRLRHYVHENYLRDGRRHWRLLSFLKEKNHGLSF